MCEVYHKIDKTKQKQIICEEYHIIRASVVSVRMSIKTILKTKRIKEYKIVKMGIKSGGDMGKLS